MSTMVMGHSTFYKRIKMCFSYQSIDTTEVHFTHQETKETMIIMVKKRPKEPK
jgi:hypothetical protein